MTLDLAGRAKEGFLEEWASLSNSVLGPQDDVCWHTSKTCHCCDSCAFFWHCLWFMASDMFSTHGTNTGGPFNTCNSSKQWEFPGCIVVRIPCFHCHGPGLIPSQETEIPEATWCSQKKKSSSWVKLSTPLNLHSNAVFLHIEIVGVIPSMTSSEKFQRCITINCSSSFNLTTMWFCSLAVQLMPSRKSCGSAQSSPWRCFKENIQS